MADSTVDPLFPGGAALLALVDAAVLGDSSVLPAAERVRDDLGAEALVDAAGVIGNFEMMNRIADATGMPVSSRALAANQDIVEALRLDRWRGVG